MKKIWSVIISIIISFILVQIGTNSFLEARTLECNDMSTVKIKKSVEENTRDLLVKILNDSSLIEVMFFNSKDNFMDIAKDNISSFEELVNKDDCLEVVASYYKEYAIFNTYKTRDDVFGKLSQVKEKNRDNINKTIEQIIKSDSIISNVNKDLQEIAKVFFLEELLTSKELLSKADNSEIAYIREVAYIKYNEKKDSVVHNDNCDNIYERALEKNVNKLFDVENSDSNYLKKNNVKKNNSYKDNPVNATVKTPKGHNAKVLIYEYFGDEMAALLDMKAKNEYPNAEILATSDNRYNCHSYAWYQADTDNRYWMITPIVYLIEGSYEKTSQIDIGNKVVWLTYDMKRISYIEHSGIVESIDGDNVIIVSKWGEGPLMRHNVNYSPYRHGIEYFRNVM